MRPFNLFLFIGLTFFASATYGQIRLKMSPACAEWLAPSHQKFISHIEKLISGSGDLVILTGHEVQRAVSTQPVQKSLADYLSLSRVSHEAVFAILPDTAQSPHNMTASTYLDNPTPYFMISKDHQWLAVEKAPANHPKALHIVTLSARADELSILHEVSHLEDMDELYQLALDSLQDHNRLLVRMDIFRIITELRAYKKMYQAYVKIDPSTEEEIATYLVGSMKSDFVGSISALPIKHWLVLARLFQITSPDDKDLKNFLSSKAELPSFRSALLAFHSNDVIKVGSK